MKSFEQGVNLFANYLKYMGVGMLGVFIIIGVIMPLLPGVALTNCIRDIMNGDLVSGSARLMEALLTGGCIAVGAGIVMLIFTANGGVILQ